MKTHQTTRITLTALATVTALALWSTAKAPDNPPPQNAALGTARQWFNALTQAKVDEAMAVSDVPFSWDRRELIKDRAGLRKMYREVADDKGARKIPLTESFIVSGKDAGKLLSRAYAGTEKNVVLVKLMIDDEAVLVAVRPGPPPKVIGFSD